MTEIISLLQFPHHDQFLIFIQFHQTIFHNNNFNSTLNCSIYPQNFHCHIISQMKNSLIKRINGIFPNLYHKQYKGQNGRIAVIGGSYQFTGAPYYSAISALKVGADMAHIFCSKASSSSIKSYSPQIIVHPVFISHQQKKLQKAQLHKQIDQWIQKIKSWEKAIHCWIIGPGLGKDPYMHLFFPELIKNIGRNKIVVFDADGIYYLTSFPEVFKYLKQCKTIITPNYKQLNYLKPYFKFDYDKQFHYIRNEQQIQELPLQYRNLHEYSILIKGQQDIILGPRSFVVRTKGGLKRCAGIGDVLAGITAVCSLWDFQLGPVLAARIVRKATYLAYQCEGRSMTSLDLIKHITTAVKQIQKESQ